MMGGYTTTASTGESWTTASYFKLAGGSLTNVSEMRISVTDSSGSSFTAFTPTNAALRTQRVTHARVLGTTTSVGNLTRITTSGVADFTLRVGLPQLELGSFATSPIRTSGATVTRAADRLTYNLAANAPWFQSSSGYTYSLDFISPSNSQGGAVFFGMAAGSFDNTSYLTSAFNYRVNTNGVGASLSLNTELQINRAAVSINYSGARFGFNNDTRLVSNQGYPLMTTFAVLSSPWLAANFAAGWARSAALSNYYYSDAELKALVT
jgi:hypothetical protein